MPFGVYVHVPFCAKRCDYCDFATWTDRAHLMEDYVDACITDVAARYAQGGHPPAGTVFFGGGTPSLLPADLLARLLDAIPRTDDAEVTVECNPDSVDPDKLAAYRRFGVNRLSLGVQSMADHVLGALGRTHDRANVTKAVGWLREAGFPTFNLDLIYGAASESLDDWARTLDAALELDPPHVSAYALTVEPGTPLATRIDAGETGAPDDDDQADKYRLADGRLSASGRSWYEISNWAEPGHECRHNRLYWEGGDYLGIGCAAHGFTEGRRWWTVRTPERYIGLVREGSAPEAGAEVLDGARRDGERIMLEVRTREGAALAPPLDGVAAGLADAGLMEMVGDRAVLTLRGRLMANAVTVRLLEALDAPGAPAAPTPVPEENAQRLSTL